MSISGTMGITSLSKGMLNDAKRYSNRDIGQELIKVAQESLSNKAPQNGHYNGGCSKTLPTVKYLNDLESDVKIINAHMSATNRLGRQYENLLKNSRNLEQTQQNIEEQVVLNTLRQARNSYDLLNASEAIPVKMINQQQQLSGSSAMSSLAGNMAYPLNSKMQPQRNNSNEPLRQHINFDLEIRAKPADKIVSGKNIFEDSRQADMFKIVPLDYVTSS